MSVLLQATRWARREVERASVRDSTTTPIVGVAPAAPTPRPASLPRPLPSRPGFNLTFWRPGVVQVRPTAARTGPSRLRGLWLLGRSVDEVRLERVKLGTRVTLRQALRPAGTSGR
jgi:hypothetical protein